MTKITLKLSKILIALMMLTSRLSFIQVSAHGGATLDFDIDKFDVSENYNIDYSWELNKTVDPTDISLLLGGSQLVTYSVTATRDAQSTFSFTYDFDVKNKGDGTAIFGIDVQLVNASGSMVLATKSITPSLTLLEDQTQSYKDTIVFTLSENIYDKPLKIQLIINEISNVGSINGLRSAAFKFDDAPTHTYNASLLVSDDLSGNTWTFLNTGVQTYTQAISAGTNIGDHTVVNTVTGLGSNGFVPTPDSATVTVHTSNNPPVANAQSLSTNEDTALPITLTGSDPDGQSISFTNISNPTHGSISGTGANITYTPDSNYFGPDSFTFKSYDGYSYSPAATITLTVNAVNDAPSANNDAYSTSEDTLLTVPANGVLANDSDVEGTTLTTTLVSAPTHGSLTLNADGSLTYQPAPNYTGSDSFTYRASDGLLSSNEATVELTMTSVNDAPVGNADAYSTSEDTLLTVVASGVLSNDVDLDSASLMATLETNPTHGLLTLNTDGSFTYMPDANYFGSDSFSYKAYDGSLSSEIITVTLSINAVNDSPIAMNDEYTTDEDTVLTVPASGVLTNDTDIELYVLSVDTYTQGTHGSVVVQDNGSFVYTPDANYFGSDSFTYSVKDANLGTSNTATVYLTINPVNDAPVAENNSYSTFEDTLLTIPANGVLGNDSDVDLDALTSIIVTTPIFGDLVFNADGSFTYMPHLNYDGVDSFIYKVYDGSAYSNTATVSISMVESNDAPVAFADAYSTSEDGTLTVLVAEGVLHNDTDVDNTLLTAVLDSTTSHGTLTLNSDGSYTYTPTADWNGIDSFTYHAHDGMYDSAVVTVTITVNAVNDNPIALDDSVLLNEDAQTFILETDLLVNDSDVDGLSLHIVDFSQPSHGTLTFDGTTFTYTPVANYFGLDSFTYYLSDSNEGTDTAVVNLTITPINDAPVGVNDVYSTLEDTVLTSVLATQTSVLSNDSDPVEGSALSAVLVTSPAFGSLVFNSDGTFVYTPQANWFGVVEFTYTVSDGDLIDTPVTVTLTVSAVNDVPVALPLAFTLANAGTSTGLLTGTDLETSELTYNLVTLPVNGTVVLVGNAYIYSHNGSTTLTDSFTFTVTDEDESTSLAATATITILAAPIPPVVNLAPEATPHAFTIANGATTSGIMGGYDPEGASLTFALVTSALNGSLSFGSDGAYVYTHNGTTTTSDSFSFTVNDGSITSNPASVSITILPLPTPPAANTAPVAVDGTGTTLVNNAYIDGVIANDADGDTLTYTLLDTVEHGMLVLRADGSFTYSPFAGYVGQDSFTFSANDGALDSNVGTYTFTIEAAEVVVSPAETPLAALPVSLDLSWLYWLAGLSAAFLNFLAFLRPNLKYRLITRDGQVKTLRRRIARPDGDILFIDLDDKHLDNLVDVDVILYKRLAKHLGNVTVSFMMNNRIVQTITIPESQDEEYTTLIHL